MEKQTKRLLAVTIFCLNGILSACFYPEPEVEPMAKTDRIAENPQTELKILYSRDDITWSLLMDDLCSKFEAENLDINLILQESGNGIYEENLKIKEALNELPDLFEIQNPDSYIRINRLGEIPTSVSDLLENPQYIDNKVFTVPLYTTTYGIIYNHVLFKQYQLKVPETYDEFLDICQELGHQGIIPITCGGTKDDSVAYWLNYFYQKNVGELPITHKPSFTDEQYLDMLKDYNWLITSEHVLKDSVYMNDSQIISQFLDSKVAMYYTKPSFIANLILADPNCTSSTKNNFGEELEDVENTVRLAWFFLPTRKGVTVAATEIGSQLAISRECAEDPQRYQAAERFLQFLFEDENYREILKSMYGFQTTEKRILYPAPSVLQNLIVDYRYARKEESFLTANHISGGFKNELSKALYLLAGNSMTPEETAWYLNRQWSERSD